MTKRPLVSVPHGCHWPGAGASPTGPRAHGPQCESRPEPHTGPISAFPPLRRVDVAGTAPRGRRSVRSHSGFPTRKSA